VHPLAVVLSVTAGGMVAGIGGAVVAVPLVAVTNTVVGYLKAYAEEQAVLAGQEDSAPPDFEDETVRAEAGSAVAAPRDAQESTGGLAHQE
jgi:hypothetical protein